MSEDQKDGMTHEDTGTSKNFEVTKDIRSERKSDEKQDSISLPIYGHEGTEKALENAVHLKLADNEKTQDWYVSLNGASDALLRNDALKHAVTNTDAFWRQSVQYDGRELGAGRPKIGGGSSGERLFGEAAVMKVTSVLQTGALIQVPLWHTGIWVSIKAPTESAILELERMLTDNKIVLGRNTMGMIFSNSSVYLKRDVANFIIDHIYDSTLSNMSKERLLDTILSTDYPQLVWGMISTIYPNGYPLSQPCTAKVGECSHVVEEHINLARLSWTDTTRLGGEQIKHMSNRIRKVTDEELAVYQKGSDWHLFKDIKINDVLGIDIKVPTLSDYIKSGDDWVTEITTIINNQLGSKGSAKERSDAISTQAKIMNLRQYSHWIDRLTVQDGDDVNFIDDRDTIEDTMTHLSGATDIARTIRKEIGKHINLATITLIGLPNYTCPKCGGRQDEEEGTNLIPLDVEQIFFTLNLQRIQKILMDKDAL